MNPCDRIQSLVDERAAALPEDCRQHIRDCGDCRRAAEPASFLAGLLPGVSGAPRADFAERVVARLAEESRERTGLGRVVLAQVVLLAGLFCANVAGPARLQSTLVLALAWADAFFRELLGELVMLVSGTTAAVADAVAATGSSAWYATSAERLSGTGLLIAAWLTLLLILMLPASVRCRWRCDHD